MIKKTIGLFIIILGILVFLSNTSIIDFGEISKYLFPSLVLIVGVVGMVEKKKFDVFYFIILLLGLSSLVLALEIFEKSLIQILLFPVIMVLIGIRILNFKIRSTVPSSKKNYSTIFGGLEERNNNKEFESCDITSIFGGCTIDFRNIKLKDNKAHINVFVLFGGAELLMPKKFKITSDGIPLFGAFDTKLLEEDDNSKNEVVINYTAIFGGIEIKN